MKPVKPTVKTVLIKNLKTSINFPNQVWRTRLSKEGRMENALPLLLDEGRTRLRKAARSCQGSLEAQISEWGNPAEFILSHP